ncbi:hypothetical protein M3Y99_01293500 [Aphelenchoides fujianensis]|nr:hypothetical protein M3Y99_01293500 [Aphelenchoides fujianensis]
MFANLSAGENAEVARLLITPAPTLARPPAAHDEAAALRVAHHLGRQTLAVHDDPLAVGDGVRAGLHGRSLRGSLISIVGNGADVDSELLAPFHTVVAKSTTNLAAQRKIAWVCRSMKKFGICIQPCGESRAKALRMTTTQQWEEICAASKKEPKAFGDFIGCERRHHERALKKCPVLQVSSTTSLDSFCRRLNDYTDCYSKVPFPLLVQECNGGRRGLKRANNIWMVVNQAVQHSYERILELSAGHLRLPAECEWSMRNIAMNRPSESSDEAEDRDEYEVESLSWKRRTSTPHPSTSSARPSAEDRWSLATSTLPPPSFDHDISHSTHRHRSEHDLSEYSVDDIWEGVREVPLHHDHSAAPPTDRPPPLWAQQAARSTSERPELLQRTPFLTDPAAFGNSADRLRLSAIPLLCGLLGALLCASVG